MSALFVVHREQAHDRMSKSAKNLEPGPIMLDRRPALLMNGVNNAGFVDAAKVQIGIVSSWVSKDTAFCINPRQYQISLTNSTSGP